MAELRASRVCWWVGIEGRTGRMEGEVLPLRRIAEELTTGRWIRMDVTVTVAAAMTKPGCGRNVQRWATAAGGGGD